MNDRSSAASVENPLVRFDSVCKRFGGDTILDGVDLGIRKGSYSVLLGGPASGKSTLLRLLTGLEKPDAGRITLRGEDVVSTSPGERNIGYVPQSFALYPHYSVYDNIAYPLKLARTPRSAIETAVHEAARKLGIADFLKQKPDQLSGGQKQRVAIARGMVKDTDIFILDDPLTGLDFKLREQLFDDFRAMQADLGATFIHATSDTLEAQMLAQDIHVLDGGRIVEAGDFETIFDQPRHVRSMALLGYPKANLLPATYEAGVVRTPCFDLPADGLDTSGQCQVAIRPQHLWLAAADTTPVSDTTALTFSAELTLIENLGGEFVAYLQAGEQLLSAVLRHDERGRLVEGPVNVSIEREQVVLYELHSGKRIEAWHRAGGALQQARHGMAGTGKSEEVEDPPPERSIRGSTPDG